MNASGVDSQNIVAIIQRIRPRRGLLFGILIVAALIAFEIFNYSTTDFALADLLGDLRFLGIRWATILAIAFCGIDFAGIARLFTPEDGVEEPAEVWYLFGAWMLAATMNAMLTWWGVSIAVLNHETLGNAVVERQTLLQIVPIFVAVLVWLIRVLIIGTLSVAGERLFSQASTRTAAASRPVSVRTVNTARPDLAPISRPRPTAAQANPVFRPSHRAGNQGENGNGRSSEKDYSQTTDAGYSRGEPTYHPIAMEGRRREGTSSTRR